MEHLLFFQSLIEKLNSKYTVGSINMFIEEYYSEILERQYEMDIESGIVFGRDDFYLQLKDEYSDPKFSKLDEKTFRRWRNKELKNGLKPKYFKIFQEFPATEELFNEYYLKNLSNGIMKQSELFFLKTCFSLKDSKMLDIIDFIIPFLKNKNELSREDYLKEFKNALLHYEAYLEYEMEHEFEEYSYLPKYSFNREKSTVVVPYEEAIGKNAKMYIVENKKQPNIMAEILKQNHFQKALENEN